MATIAQIALMAEISSFYIAQNGSWLRIQSTSLDEGFFTCYDSDECGDYIYVNFDEVDLTKEKFMRSVETTVNDIVQSGEVVSIPLFASACAHLTHEQIYKLFEAGISKELRNEILKTVGEDSVEPVRDALRNIGEMYNIQNLINY